MAAFPIWLHDLSILSVTTGLLCALFILVDEVSHRQSMAVMYAVWPLTALFGGPIWLWAYLAFGRRQVVEGQTPVAEAVFKSTSHCGAGCTLGDIAVEWFTLAVPAMAVWFGYGSLFHEQTFAIWVPDFLVAFLIGVAFQYWAIRPMRDLSWTSTLWLALKADAASITAWQFCMYGGMAAIQFGLLRPDFGRIAPVASPEFWFVMQLAMLAGFVTAFPVNWWLIRAEVKEKM